MLLPVSPAIDAIRAALPKWCVDPEVNISGTKKGNKKFRASFKCTCDSARVSVYVRYEKLEASQYCQEVARQ